MISSGPRRQRHVARDPANRTGMGYNLFLVIKNATNVRITKHESGTTLSCHETRSPDPPYLRRLVLAVV